MTAADIINSFTALNLTKKELKQIDASLLCDDVALYYGHNYSKQEVFNHVLTALTSDTAKRNEELFLKVLSFISIY